jgi:hypothetical protein
MYLTPKETTLLRGDTGKPKTTRVTSVVFYLTSIYERGNWITKKFAKRWLGKYGVQSSMAHILERVANYRR